MDTTTFLALFGMFGAIFVLCFYLPIRLHINARKKLAIQAEKYGSITTIQKFNIIPPELIISTHESEIYIEMEKIQELVYNNNDLYAYMQYADKKYALLLEKGTYRQMMPNYVIEYQETKNEQIKKELERRKSIIVQFVKKNVGLDISPLYTSMEHSSSIAINTRIQYDRDMPVVPRYSTDDMFSIDNALKKEEYDKQLNNHLDLMFVAYQYKGEFEKKANEIGDIIMGIPKHQEYLAIHREICSELRAELNKAGLK